jgi:hypothetical protein
MTQAMLFYVFILKMMKYPIYLSLPYLTIPMVTSNTLVLVLLASRAHAHDLLLVSVLVSEVELLNVIMCGLWTQLMFYFRFKNIIVLLLNATILNIYN